MATRNSISGATQLYVDGVLDAGGTGPAGQRASSPKLRIGAIGGNTESFPNGTIDQLQSSITS